MVEGDEMRERFDRAYKARLDAGHKIPVGRGVWVSMFLPEDPNAPSSVGGGIALGRDPLLTTPMEAQPEEEIEDVLPDAAVSHGDTPLTIAEAKSRLASSLGVDPEKVIIVIEA